MNPRIKVAVTALAFAIPAFVLGPIIWPPALGSPMPPRNLLPFFALLVAIESLTFGLGMAFVLYGLPVVNRVVGGSQRLTLAVYLSITWLLISWWPHGYLHQHNGPSNMLGLLLIEYGFHALNMVAGLIVAYTLVLLARRSGQAHAVPAKGAQANASSQAHSHASMP